MAKYTSVERIGGGNIRIVQVSKKGKIIKVRSRGGLFKGDIRVVASGRYAGRILIPFWSNVLVHTAIKEGDYNIAYRDQKNLIYQMFDNVYGALRYTYHLLEKQYGITFLHGERGRLTIAIKQLEAYNDAVVNLRKDTADQLGLELMNKTGEILQQIGLDSRDEYKRDARDLVVSLSSVLDSSGKVNQSVKMAKSIAAQNRLESRKINIASIEPHIISRRQTLKAVIDEMELYWLGVYDFLTRLFTIHGKYEYGRLLSLLRESKNRTIIINRLSYYCGKLGQYDIIPFVNTGRYVGNELAIARQEIENSSYPLAISILSKSWHSLKLRQIRTELERALTILTCSLFGDSVRVDKKAFDAVIFICRQQVRILKEVDESNFDYPVTKKSITLLQATAGELIKKNISSAKKARGYLKDAASIL